MLRSAKAGNCYLSWVGSDLCIYSPEPYNSHRIDEERHLFEGIADKVTGCAVPISDELVNFVENPERLPPGLEASDFYRFRFSARNLTICSRAIVDERIVETYRINPNLVVSYVDGVPMSLSIT